MQEERFASKAKASVRPGSKERALRPLRKMHAFDLSSSCKPMPCWPSHRPRGTHASSLLPHCSLAFMPHCSLSFLPHCFACLRRTRPGNIYRATRTDHRVAKQRRAVKGRAKATQARQQRRCHRSAPWRKHVVQSSNPAAMRSLCTGKTVCSVCMQPALFLDHSVLRSEDTAPASPIAVLSQRQVW